MKIAICGSLDFTHEIKSLADELIGKGFEVEIPPSSRKILNGEFTVDDIKFDKNNGNFPARAIKSDAIREYWKTIGDSDAILVANFDKKGVKNYIGGNTFLEMGFAHVLNKRIFLLNDIPEMIYSDEIKAMQPTVLGGALEKVLNS
jgi:hypothetical protein